MSIFERVNRLSGTYLRWVVLLAVVVTVVLILWPYSEPRETDIVIPIDYGKTAAGLTIAGGTHPKSIEVRVKGAEKVIKALANHKLSYKIDLTGMEKGFVTVPIDLPRIVLPPGVTALSVQPKQVSVRIEQEVTRQVQVKVVLSGKPAAGFEVADAVSRPGTVFLRGADNVLAGVKTVESKPIDVNGLKDTVKREIALNLPPGTDIIFPSGVMRAEVFIEPKQTTKKITGLPVNGVNARYRFSINPPSVDIVVSGPMVEVEKLDLAKDIQIYVDLKDLKPGIYPRRATLNLPVAISLVDVKPELFTVKIEKQPLKIEDAKNGAKSPPKE